MITKCCSLSGLHHIVETRPLSTKFKHFALVANTIPAKLNEESEIDNRKSNVKLTKILK